MTTPSEFREFAHAMIEYIVSYQENIDDRNVLPSVRPGYIRELLPAEAPEEPETWQKIMEDLEPVVMQGVTHWHSPHFHAYFPTANAYPSIVADMLSDAIGCVGFSWIASPACTELEMVMMDWLGKMLKLPNDFLFSSVSEIVPDGFISSSSLPRTGRGGGVIQGSASESTLVALMSARSQAVCNYTENNPALISQPDMALNILHRMVGYASKLAHSSVERAGLLGGVKVRLLDPSEDEGILSGDTLEKAMAEDEAKGLIPFFVTATLGTTSCSSFDNLPEIGLVCRRRKVWLHVDAAYAGSAFICPEYRHMLNGIELADSFNMNPHKWLLVNTDCSAMWVKNSAAVVDAFNVDPIYLKHSAQGIVPDYRHWSIPLSRRFRSLKVWFTLRLYGQKRMREYIREHVRLADEFKDMVTADERFELAFPPKLSLVCFRLKGPNHLTELLNKAINDTGKVHVTPSKIGQIFFIRFVIGSRATTSVHVKSDWNVISGLAAKILEDHQAL